VPLQAGFDVRKSVLILSVTTASVLLSSNNAGWADDWGYEAPHEVKPIKAVALPLKPAGGAAAKAPVKPKPSPVVAARVAPTAPRTVAPKTVSPGALGGVASTKLDYAAECWNQIYQIASGKKLTDEQKKKLGEVVKKAPNSQSVTAFWPKVTEYLVLHPEQKENYVRLLRALLRWKARTLTATAGGAAPSAIATEEAGLIGEVLGPERLAVPGSPAFSEEAVEAYADMACFLYEQQNPGKTIDAFDNRAMFASVVCEKFRNAPTDKDKRAMAAFDLQWAKFKVAWEAANESTRKDMLTLLEKSGAGSAEASTHDPVLHSILENWRI
jgi:hypothetical protein